MMLMDSLSKIMVFQWIVVVVAASFHHFVGTSNADDDKLALLFFLRCRVIIQLSALEVCRPILLFVQCRLISMFYFLSLSPSSLFSGWLWFSLSQYKYLNHNRSFYCILANCYPIFHSQTIRCCTISMHQKHMASNVFRWNRKEEEEEASAFVICSVSNKLWGAPFQSRCDELCYRSVCSSGHRYWT